MTKKFNRLPVISSRTSQNKYSKELVKISDKDQDGIKMDPYDLESYETIMYESLMNFNKDLRYSWLFFSPFSNVTMKNRYILLDLSGNEYIQIDSLVMDLGERWIFLFKMFFNEFYKIIRQLFIQSSRNNREA